MPSIKPTARVQAQMETILVATVATEQTGALVDTTTALNLDNGSIGTLSSDLDGSPAFGNFVTAGNVGASTNESVMLVQGTPLSSQTQKVSPWEVNDKAYVSSDIIHKGLVRSYHRQDFNSGTYNAVQLAGITAPAVATEYKVYVRMLSVKNDLEFGGNDDVITALYETPASLTGITNATDKVLQELASDINLRSRAAGRNKNVVVLGIKVAGGAGVTLGSVSTAGTSIPFMSVNGVQQTIVSDTALVRTFLDQIDQSSLTAASTIEVINLATAGDAAKIDVLLFVALDENLAAIDDDVMSQLTILDVNPAGGLLNDGTVTTTAAIPATGTGRQWNIYNNRRAQLRVHTLQNHPHGEVYSDGISYVNATKNYGAYIVEFYDYEDTLTTRSVSEKKAIILFEQTEDTETVTSALANMAEMVPLPAIALVDTVNIGTLITTFETWVG